MIRPELVHLNLQGKERDEVLLELVTFLKKAGWISKEKELLSRLSQREDLGSTAIGDGVAIPHCKLKSVKEPILLLAVSQQGVNFLAPDGSMSHIFFLVVSSPDNPSLNLQILAGVAHLVRKAEDLMKRFLQAPDAEAVVRIVQEEEKRLHE